MSIKRALEAAAVSRAERTSRFLHEPTAGELRLSMPAAETFTAIALASAVQDALENRISSVIAVVDCAPAATALSALYSAAPQLRHLVGGAVRVSTRWLGVAVSRDLNSIADILSHPSRRDEVYQQFVSRGFTLRHLSVSTQMWDLLLDAASLPMGAEDGEADEHEVCVVHSPPSHQPHSRS